MKNQLPTQSLITRKTLFLIVSFFLLGVTSLFAQEIVLEKAVTETTSCNEFDVTLTITGNPPPIPQEVILVIDRSGSMGFDIPNDPNEPIDYAKDAAIDFVNNLFLAGNNPTGLNRVGIVSYSTSGTLDIGLTNSSGQASIIAAINALVANGGTNIARGMDVADDEMTANGTFDCITSRSIILLTDGVTNRDLNGDSCTSSPSPPFPAGNTDCMNDAINESVGAQTTTVSGTVYDQTIFSVGLFGAISGDQQAAATHVMDESQNGGLFTTESAADLTGIYNQILGQLALAARDGVVTDVLGTGFALVAGSLSDPVNATYNSGTNTITWNVGDITDETLTLDYTITAVGMQGCGIQNVGSSEITYVDDTCNSVVTPFPNPEVCVPCPDITDPVIDQVECTDSVDYSATFTPGDCSPVTIEFEWEFFLNNVSVGTASGTSTGDLSGTFVYTGGDPFAGDFRAELTYNGIYSNGCALPPVEVESEIQVFLPPDAPMAGDDQAECLDTQNPQTLTATATVLGGQSVVWYDAATDGNLVPDPSWSSIGSVTYYAETVDDSTNCVSTTRIPVTLTLYDCAIQIEKTASPNDTQNCNTIAPGEDITYTFTVTNQGNVDITNVEVTDPLIDPVNPIPGPASGDANNNGILEVGETWIYTAVYTVVQADIINGQVDNTAEVDGTVTGSSASFGVNDSDSVTVVLCQNAEVSITKSSDGDTGNCNAYEVNDVVNYTFTVTNEGDVDITDVVVTDANLGGAVAGPASGDTGNDGVLGVGEVWIYNATYNVTQADIDAEEITNTADVNGNTGLGAVTDTSNTVVLAICTTKSIALIKVGTYDGFDVNGNCIAAPGDTITYAFTVTNTGNVTLTNVVVTDPLVTMVGGPIASLAPGAVDNTTFTASYVLTQA
ncbi:MAG: VWA domain-containing protein, partial [Bacteroidota bacterium]